ncbi:Sulfite reductase [NADPH] flavoprotein alpha-component [Raoultella terrigena]|uniref:Sulfite reductase [NADPH] flavoprotein alpha-component n=1 Tax=Raoultella terrigena TaxID=577 RepID=A0A3P8KG65_RAOTE|nr:Sulfite reductase [NADPH] flavoprotein alpha-component [Raoultella terrigena]
MSHRKKPSRCINSCSRKKAPKLEGTAFAVFGLGDTSYEFFCQSGKDFDSRLAELGGERLLDRVDSDVEYQGAAPNGAPAWSRC